MQSAGETTNVPLGRFTRPISSCVHALVCINLLQKFFCFGVTKWSLPVRKRSLKSDV